MHCAFFLNSRLVQVHEIWERSQRRAQSDEASSCLIDGERKALVALPSLTGRRVDVDVCLSGRGETRKAADVPIELISLCYNLAVAHP